jgi:hypothetical protein
MRKLLQIRVRRTNYKYAYTYVARPEVSIENNDVAYVESNLNIEKKRRERVLGYETNQGNLGRKRSSSPDT